jgi:hypothetical protein
MEKIRLSDKICLVVDNGQFTYMAQYLSKYFKKVYYYKSYNAKGFPSPNDYYSGYGLDGVTHVNDIFDKTNDYNFDKVDLFCFFDLYYGSLQEQLVSMGKRVWGAKTGEEMELDRWGFKLKLKELGLPVATSKKVIGVKNLIAYLKLHPNQYVKISRFRGLIETFKVEYYETSKYMIDQITSDLGALQDIMPFICEDKVDAIFEDGFDSYSVDGQYPKKNIYGVEIKDACYACKVIDYDQLPKHIKEVNKKFAPYFKSKNYASMISTETRLTKAKVGYFIDITCFSKDTEVLTNHGWKYFYELDGSEKICTLNPNNNNIEYHEPVNYTSYHYNGDMISISNINKDLDLLVTPNHNVWVKNRDKTKLFSLPAEKLTGKYFIPRIGNWVGANTEYFVLPEYHNEWDSGKWMKVHKIHHCEEKKIKMEDWLRFMAIYLSDGSCRKESAFSINIAQFDRCDEYANILNKLPFEIHKDRHGFTIHDVQLAMYLKQFGKCNEKYVPEFIKDLSPKLINIFLDTYQIADGYIKAGKRTFFTTSKQLSDDLQELCFKSGKVASVFEKKVKGTTMKIGDGKTYVRKFNAFYISERNKYLDFYLEGWNSKRCNRYLNKVHYDDMVYDVEVPNHILYVRRNGKSCWSGNCRNPEPPGAIYPLIIDNLAEIFWFGGENILIEPEFNSNYAVEVIMTSDELASGTPVSIDFPKKYEKNICLRYAVKINGKYSVLPQDMPEVGQIVATGKTLQEALDNVKEIAESIKGNVHICLDRLDKVVEEVKKTKTVGIDF